MRATSVECCCVTLGKVIGLDSGRLTPQPFPINFVKVIRLQDKRRDDPVTRRRFKGSCNRAEKYIVCTHWSADKIHAKELNVPFEQRVGDCPSPSIVKCKPLPSCEIFSPEPNTIQSLSTPVSWKLNVVEAPNAASSGHDFLVGSQSVDVCEATNGIRPRSTDDTMKNISPAE